MTPVAYSMSLVCVLIQFRQIGNNRVIVMTGSYSFTALDGLVYVVDWYADDTGFHPAGLHLPVVPEIPFPEQAAAVDAQINFAEETRSKNLDIREFNFS